MLRLSEYNETRCATVLIEPSDISCVREYAYHSFRPLIAEIVLKSGASVKVWETVGQVEAMLKREAALDSELERLRKQLADCQHIWEDD